MNNQITRKDFMKYSAATGAAMLLNALQLHADEQKLTNLKVAIIGCGSVSNRYIPHLQTSSMVEIVALCDIKYERALEEGSIN